MNIGAIRPYICSHRHKLLRHLIPPYSYIFTCYIVIFSTKIRFRNVVNSSPYSYYFFRSFYWTFCILALFPFLFSIRNCKKYFENEKFCERILSIYEKILVITSTSPCLSSSSNGLSWINYFFYFSIFKMNSNWSSSWAELNWNATQLLPINDIFMDYGWQHMAFFTLKIMMDFLTVIYWL